MYRIAENKSIKIGQVTRLLKEYAVDCLLNKNQQNMNANNIQKNITLTLPNKTESFGNILFGHFIDVGNPESLIIDRLITNLNSCCAFNNGPRSFFSSTICS